MLEQSRKLRLAGLALVVVALLLVASDSDVWEGIGLGAGLACLAVLVFRDIKSVVYGRLDQSRDWLQLRRVHPRFADALNSYYEQAGITR